MQYREFTPRPELRGVVRCVWMLVAPAGGDEPPERVLPDGCAEIILNRADRFQRIAEHGGARRQAETLLVGQMRRAIRIAPSGAVDLLGVRFEPGGLFTLLGVPMHELTDVDVALGQVHPRLQARLHDAARAADLRSRVARVEAVLCEHVHRRGGSIASGWLVAAAAQRLDTPASDVHEVAAALRVSPRTLERAFRDRVGLAPKHYARIQRLQSVVGRLETYGALPAWAHLALEHGFADQSHLIREFRSLAGTTPARWLSEQTTMSDLFTQAALSHSSNP